MKIDHQFRIDADARIVAKAYAVYIDQILKEIQKLHEENNSDYLSREKQQMETEESIFRFVLKNFGRQKLIEMGRFIDERATAKTGQNSGYEEYLTDSAGDYAEPAAVVRQATPKTPKDA
jgi:hypothetical protein